jgi:hypothetical protein
MMFKSFNDFMNQFFKFSIFMFIFVMGLWLFSCAQESFGNDLVVAEDQPEACEDCGEAIGFGITSIDSVNPGTVYEIHDKEIPALGGGKDWGYSLPKIERIIIDEGVRIYVIFRQYPLFSYEDEMPADHVFRAILEVENGKIKLVGYQNAKVTAPREVPEKIEW